MKVRIKKTIAFLLLFNLLFLEIGLMPISNAGSSEVTTVAELQEAVSIASDGEVIALSDSFVSGEIEITMPNVNVMIDGNNVVWNKGSTVIKDKEEENGIGSLTFKNLKYDGSSISNNIIVLEHTNGTVNFENIEFYNFTKGVMKVNTGAKTELDRTWFHDNTATNTAPAIWLGENANVDIKNSTFENNTGTGGGYETGAISSLKYRGNLNISNSVFRNNVNKTVNTGVTGGGGGAMAIHYFYGKVNIKDSTFDGNQTNGSGVDVKSTYDGGAIYILDGRDGATFDITGSTFMNNIAYDDGGAIMFQGTGNPGLTTTITNSTFYNNKAYGLDGANYSGGAIQYFKNGGSAKMTNNILSSTFVGNEAGGNGNSTEQRGGAIGLSGAGMFAMAAVTRNDSLFIGNKVYGTDGQINTASNYKDLSNYTTTQAGEGKANVINVDKGLDEEATKAKIKDVLGRSEPILSSNQSEIKAGFVDESVMTIPIRPKGIADNGYGGTVVVPENDQRGFKRYQDYGAVEMAWIKYDANGGYYDVPKNEIPPFIGEQYYNTNNVDKILEYFTIGKNGEQTTVYKPKYLTHDEGKVLLG